MSHKGSTAQNPQAPQEDLKLKLLIIKGHATPPSPFSITLSPKNDEM